jgi:cob(I)alamin adenosyltransferase
MKIYTKTGDKGSTSLFGGKRVSKDSVRIEAYGTVDELNSLLGICRTLQLPGKIDSYLLEIQNQLFILGADLASPVSQTKRLKVPRIKDDNVKYLEKAIDFFEKTNEPLRAFIIPGGSVVSAQLHFARTVCRRAERLAVRLSEQEKIGKFPVIYLNRLSDLLFVMARWANKSLGISDIKWADES